jgi:Protein of unknown function (DUF2938)
MSDLRARLRAGLPGGIVATITMDAAMVAAAAIGGEAFASERVGPAVIGRWGGGLLRGQLRHVDASRETSSALDVPLGLMTHYLTGIALTEAFVATPAHRSFRAAVAYGIATSVFPLFVLFPSLGYGPVGLRSGEAARLARIMLVGHVAFGAGIGLGSLLSGSRRR